MARKQRMAGKELQKAIIDLAHMHRWRVARFESVQVLRGGKTHWMTPVSADGKGWPDLFLVRENRAMAIEVKGDGDTVKKDQKEWLSALLAANIETYIATPSAWRTGVIENYLK